MMLPIQLIAFFGFSFILIISALMTILSKNPVRSALFLVLGFFAAAALWILAEAEFLGLVLIVVYVGAVMTLFLFVIMTMNIDIVEKEKGFVRHVPFILIGVVVFAGILMYVFLPAASLTFTPGETGSTPLSNTEQLGLLLYTRYAYPFILAGILLLVAIIAAISLTFRGKRARKSYSVGQQVRVRKEDRLRIIKMRPEKKQ
jgi:NADH-quinone oxidoreductase subunit J